MLNAEQQKRFLELVSRGWISRHAAARAGLSWEAVHETRSYDPGFRAQWDKGVRERPLTVRMLKSWGLEIPQRRGWR